MLASFTINHEKLSSIILRTSHQAMLIGSHHGAIAERKRPSGEYCPGEIPLSPPQIFFPLLLLFYYFPSPSSSSLSPSSFPHPLPLILFL